MTNEIQKKLSIREEMIFNLRYDDFIRRIMEQKRSVLGTRMKLNFITAVIYLKLLDLGVATPANISPKRTFWNFVLSRSQDLLLFHP
jgi:hypothetical protein